MLKKNTKVVFHDTCKLYELQTLVPINEALLEHSRPCSLGCCLWLLL